MEKQNELLINEAKSNNLAVKSNKQIEEMAKHCHFYYDGNCTLCEELWVECDNKCDMCEFAKRLYNADFRKAPDVVREIFEEIEEGVKAAISALQFENNPIHRKVKHETYSSLMRFIKTVEKKYTEERK